MCLQKCRKRLKNYKKIKTTRAFSLRLRKQFSIQKLLQLFSGVNDYVNHINSNLLILIFKGEYTFVWTWSFNGPTDMYSGCFDVIVASNKPERDTILQVFR